MRAERRINGQWKVVKDRVFPNPYYRLNSNDEWNKYEFTSEPYGSRNYDLFAILANVRNGYGWGGCLTGTEFNPISDPKGYPEDIDPETMEYMSEEHSASYLSLKELKDYDWTQTRRTFGFLSEKEYSDSVLQGKRPTSWCGDVWGANIIKVSEETMQDILNGNVLRKPGATYYCGVWFEPETYADASDDFYYKVMPILETLIPEGGTDEDVRIVFDFDS